MATNSRFIWHYVKFVARKNVNKLNHSRKKVRYLQYESDWDNI